MMMRNKEFEQLKESLAHHYRMIAHLQCKYTAETGQAFCPAGIGKYELPEYCRDCSVYTPDAAPELDVYYKYKDPDIGPEVQDITIHGQAVSDFMYDAMLEQISFPEIVYMLTVRGKNAEEDKVIEAFETKKMEG